jgi:peptidoglycan/LPS O-acetylase OafA/YrhL
MMLCSNNLPSPPAGGGPRSPRYGSIDLWRGLACLMIVVLHASFYAKDEALSPAGRREDPAGGLAFLLISRMGIGVNLFFVVSGYCIAATADAARRKRQGALHYFKGRLWRIFPPYWAALALTAAAAAALSAARLPSLFRDGDNAIPHPAELSGMQWLGNVTLSETWLQHLTGEPYNLQLGPAWSLCYEVQFYAVCGLILLVWPKRFFAGVVVVTLLTACLLPLFFVRTGPAVDGFFFDGRWLLFAAGVLVYYQLNYASGGRAVLLPAALALLLLLSLGLRYGLLAGGTWEQKGRAFELASGFAFALVLIALKPLDGRLSESKALRPLAFCGKMSYSLYLTHWPVTKAVSHALFLLGLRGTWATLALTIPLATGVSLVLAWAFYLLVERRFLNAAPNPSAVARSPAPGPENGPPAPGPAGESLPAPRGLLAGPLSPC